MTHIHPCEPFYIGTLNIYDYQRSGFYCWKTYHLAHITGLRMIAGRVKPFQQIIKPKGSQNGVSHRTAS